MPSCVFLRCGNYTSKSHGITFHAFPSDELRCLKWTNILRRQRRDEYWQPSNSSRICSVHFEDEDKYKSSKGLTLLKKTAMPIFKEPSYPRKSHYIRCESGSANSVNEENSSDSEFILDTPENAVLKKCILKLNFENRKLKQKNKNLSIRNKRLVRKVSSMKYILKLLKERLCAKNDKSAFESTKD